MGVRSLRLTEPPEHQTCSGKAVAERDAGVGRRLPQLYVRHCAPPDTYGIPIRVRRKLPVYRERDSSARTGRVSQGSVQSGSGR